MNNIFITTSHVSIFDQNIRYKMKIYLNGDLVAKEDAKISVLPWSAL